MVLLTPDNACDYYQFAPVEPGDLGRLPVGGRAHHPDQEPAAVVR